jgi:ribonuclease R
MEDFRNNNNSSDKKTHFSHKPRGEKFERSGGRERNDFHKFGRKPFHHNDNRNHEYRNKDVTSAENNSFRTEKREKEQNFERRPFVRREGGFKPRGEKFERSGSRERNDFNSRNFSNNRNNEFKSRKFDIHHEHPLDPNKDLSKLRQIVIEIIEKENNRPLPINVLTSILIKQYKDQIGYINGNEVNHVVDTLLSEKKIFQTRGNSLVNDLTKVENKNSFNNFNVSDFKIPGKGFLNINNSGNGFISLNNKDKAHYYVNKEDLNNAQNGDFVEFLATESSQDLKHLTSAIIKSVIEHAKDMYVGEIVIGCDRNEVKLDDMKSNLNIILENYDGLVNGTKILLKINKYEQNNAYASILRIIGHKDDVGVDIESIVYDNGVEIDFSQDSLEYASKITVNIDEYQRKIRTDLTSKPIVTIDPSTSKDFDDAFYCEKLNDEKYLLAVQIADPTHYIKYQSVLDKESALRGCSVYLVDRVIPMVPHNLSDDICSLNPNEERLTLSCDMIVDKEGNISDIKVFPSIIKSKRRFTYDEVNDYIEKKADFSKEDSEVKKSIDIGLEISEALYKNKKIRGYINFEIPKAVIKVDEKGEVIEITKEVHKLAQRMIEDFAVAANESVTIYAQKKNYPFIYRIHEKPEEKRLKIFSIEAKKMNFKITTDLKDIQPNDISK